MEPAHATTKASRSRCMDVIHIWNLLMLQLKHQEVIVIAWMLMQFIYDNLLMLQLKQQEIMDVIHMWNMLMLQLKHQEVVAWI